MAGATSTLTFDLLVRDKTSAGLKGATGGFKGFMATASKVTAVGMGALSAAFVGFSNDARESAKVGRLTEAVVKSTGGAAGLTADQIGKLATSISNKTGADDEAIQSGANLLATFTGIKDSVGAGNDVFTQATAAAVDMAAAMNQGEVTADGLKSANIQLGKALNDPIKGITALSKVGVSFTEQQKAQIATMIKAGDVAGAQKVILAELGKEFGGAAEAAADPMLRLQTTLGNTAETLGTILLPYIDAGAKKLATLSVWVGNNEGKVKVLLIAVGSLAATIWTVTAATKAWAAATAAWSVIQSLATAKVYAQAAAIRLCTIATTVWTAAQWLLNAALLANPIGLIIIAIVALVAVVVIIAAKTTWFQTIWNAAWGAIQAVFTAVFNFIKSNWPLILAILTGPIGVAVLVITKKWDKIRAGVSAVLTWVKSNWPLILAILTGPIGLAVLVIVKNFDKIKAAATAVKDFIVEKVQKIIDVFKGIPAKIGDMATKLKQLGIDFIQGFINGIVEKAGELPGIIKDKVVGVAKSALHGFGLFGSPSKLTMKYGRWFSEGFAIGIKDKSKDVMANVKTMMDKLKEKVSEVRSFAEAIRDAFVSSGSVTGIDTMIAGVAGGDDTEGGFAALLAGLQAKAKAAQEFAKGLTKLRKMGLNESSLAQLREAGPEGGLKATQQLLTGGKAGVGQVNALAQSISAAGAGLAEREAKAKYGFGPDGPSTARIKGQDLKLTIDGSGDELTKAIVKALRQHVRKGGGSVQVSLGSG